MDYDENETVLTTRRYYYDDQRVAVQTAVVGAAETDQRYFVFGNYIDEVLVMHDGTDDLYYAHDHLYSPVALFAANGTVAERCEYDAYGQVQVLSSGFSVLGSSQYENPYTFTGRERDTLDAGSLTLMYYRARSYDPETGRFMQRDPLEYIDGMNLYGYVKNSPLLYLDPSGANSVDRGICQLIAQGNTKEAIALLMLVYGYTYYQAATLVHGPNTCPTIPPIPLPQPKPKPDPTQPKPDPTPGPIPVPLPLPGPDPSPSPDPGNPTPPQYPGDGMRPPGDCSRDRYQVLRDAVRTACKKNIVLACRRGCSASHIRTNQARLAAINACIAAREALDYECFRGGDSGHRQQRDQLQTMKNRCEQYLLEAYGKN